MSLLDEESARHCHVEKDQAASSRHIASQRSTRFLWTGLGFAMLIAVSTCALYPSSSRTSVEAARLFPEIAFHPMPINTEITPFGARQSERESKQRSTQLQASLYGFQGDSDVDPRIIDLSRGQVDAIPGLLGNAMDPRSNNSTGGFREFMGALEFSVKGGVGLEKLQSQLQKRDPQDALEESAPETPKELAERVRAEKQFREELAERVREGFDAKEAAESARKRGWQSTWANRPRGPDWHAQYLPLHKFIAAEDLDSIAPPPTPSKAMDKTQVNVRELLHHWSESFSDDPSHDSPDWAQLPSRRHALKDLQKRQAAQMNMKRIQKDIAMDMIDHHVLGFTFGAATEDNIQAIASVGLQSETSGSIRSLAKEQGLFSKQFPGTFAPFRQKPDSNPFAKQRAQVPSEVPVVFIDALVTTPREGRHNTYLLEGHLVHRIIEWAKKMGRMVEVSPATEQLEEFYYSLGFRHVAGSPSAMMVYRGSHMEDASRPGLLLDFDLSHA